MAKRSASKAETLTTATVDTMFGAIRHLRSLDVMPMIEEGLPLGQARLLGRFLSWCQTTGTSFGHKNFDEVFARFTAAQEYAS